jgi:phospholipase/carboxylesterase
MRRMLATKEWLPFDGRAEQLILLLHGWGASGASMAPLGAALRKAFPQAAVLAPDAPNPVDGERPGRQWYSVQDLDARNWPERVAAALPGLRAWVQAQQQRLGVGPGGHRAGGLLARRHAVAGTGSTARRHRRPRAGLRRPLLCAEVARRATPRCTSFTAPTTVIPAEGSRRRAGAPGRCRATPRSTSPRASATSCTRR